MTTALHVGVAGLGLLGPGLDDWATGAPLLADPSRWTSRPTVVPAPARLPATERRRAGAVVKGSVAVADQACAMAGVDPATLGSVFASSTGDPLNCHLLCETLATPERAVSPTRFTNSVHNAAAGYWHIAVRGMKPSASLASYDATAAAGLVEAAGLCVASGEPVLLVVCDQPFPSPLHALRPLPDLFAWAMVLTPAAADTAPRLAITAAGDTATTRCADAALDALRAGAPAARALPLLQALAGLSPSTALVLEGPPGSALRVEVTR